MKIKYAFKFDAGEIQIPGERNVLCNGVLPIISHLSDPVELAQNKPESEQMVTEIQEWVKSVVTDEKRVVGLAGQITQANAVALWAPGVAALGKAHCRLFYKFLVTFWILDDFLDGNEDLEDDTIHKRMLLYSAMESAWNIPDDIPTKEIQGYSTHSSAQVILAAWQSLMKEMKAAVPSYINHSGFIHDLHNLFSDISWLGNGNIGVATSEFAYRIVRRNVAFMSGIWEFTSAICGVSISAHVRNHRDFSPMMAAFADVFAFENDIMSLRKEIDLGESYNLILVKVKQGASTLEAINETIRCIWDTSIQAMKLANSLIEAFPNEPKLQKYLDIGVHLLSGNASIHKNMPRYTFFTGEIISVQEYSCLNVQTEYIFKHLLKSCKPELK